MMLTSGSRPQDIDRCDALGIAAHLIKPVKHSELFNALAHALGANVAEDEVAQHQVQPRTRPLRILLAEDSIVNQKLAVGILERHRHLVTVANNGHEVLDMLEGRRFDVILMDIQMPKMDGLQAARAIRSAEADSERHVPIIAMTAHAMEGDREACMDAGMDDYLAKPIRAAQLYTIIHKHVGAATQAGSQDAAGTPQRVIDWKIAMQTVQGDYDLLCDLLDSFLVEGPALMQRIERAVTSDDIDDLRIAAHTIKSSFRYFGASKAQQIASELEMLARGGSVDRAVGQASELSAMWSDVENDLRQIPPRDQIEQT